MLLTFEPPISPSPNPHLSPSAVLASGSHYAFPDCPELCQHTQVPVNLQRAAGTEVEKAVQTLQTTGESWGEDASGHKLLAVQAQGPEIRTLAPGRKAGPQNLPLACNPSASEAETGSSLGQPSKVRELQVQGEKCAQKIRWRAIEKQTQCQPPAHTDTQVGKSTPCRVKNSILYDSVWEELVKKSPISCNVSQGIWVVISESRGYSWFLFHLGAFFFILHFKF